MGAAGRARSTLRKKSSGTSTRAVPLAKTIPFSLISDTVNPSTMSPVLSRRGGCDRPCGVGTPLEAPSDSCTIAYRFGPRIAVPKRTMLLIRCIARVSASASLVLVAPLSGSKRFLATMASVPGIGGAGLIADGEGWLTGEALIFAALGKSQGPSFQSQYVFIPRPTAHAINKRTISVARVRILFH